MGGESRDQRLSQITTLWSVWWQAHQGPAETVQAAQQRLLDRYGGAIRRYLGGALRDPEAAEELFQEFAVRLLHGDFRGADPGRGRLRDFMKGVLFHLIANHHQRRARAPRPLPENYPEPAAESASPTDSDQAFLTSWREDLLAHAWAKLQEAAPESGQPYYQVLRFRTDHPELRSVELALQLSARLNRPLTAAGVRQILHRARAKFGELLLEEVLHSMRYPSAELLEEELIDLGLLPYCRPALEQRGLRN
jgi:RNA polymerase sigma-70 factor (ECF subfamily)